MSLGEDSWSFLDTSLGWNSNESISFSNGFNCHDLNSKEFFLDLKDYYVTILDDGYHKSCNWKSTGYGVMEMD